MANRIENAASNPNSEKRRTGGSANDPHGGYERASEWRGPDPDPVHELVPAGSGELPATRDAHGQFAKSRADRNNDGLVSATPRVVTGKEDATMENADKKPSPNPGYEVEPGKE